MGFLEQFLEVFSELKGKNFYLSGESVSASWNWSNPRANMVVSSMLASVSSSTVPLHKQFSKCHEDVPYIANWIYEHPGLDLNLKGIWIADPSLSYNVVQQEIPTLRFVEVNIPLFYLHFSLTRRSFRPTGTYSRSIVVSWLNYRTSLMPAVIRLTWTISSLTRRKGSYHFQ